jgi:purine nucleosidase
MVRLVIDTDPGVDDAHAIMVALSHPGVRVEAITTVSGNVGVDLTTANACKILDVMGKDVPVYAGSQYALIARNPHADYVHGKDGLGDAGIPASNRKVNDEHAANALVRLGNQFPGELTLVALGPLTNLALATCLDPDLPKKYQKLVIMGGAIRAQGNTTPTTEFNIFTDPEAADIVFKAWKGLTIVSWETTMAHPFDTPQVEELMAFDTPRAEFFRKITENTIKFIAQFVGRKMLFAADFLAMAVAIEPEVVLRAETKYVEMELYGMNTRGQTVVDWMGSRQKEPNAVLPLEMDSARLWELFKMAFQ